MTDTTTQAVTALLDGVTPGPWHFFPQDGYFPRVYVGGDMPKNAGIVGHYISVNACYPGAEMEVHNANARFIAAARDLVPDLLAQRDALAHDIARHVAVAADLATDCEDLRAQLAAAETRARESALQALAAYGQAADAHAAQLAAEAKLATCEKYRDAYAECDRIGTEAVRELEAKVSQLESLTRGQAEQLEIHGNTIIRINGRAEEAEAKLATARGEALEEAARYHDQRAADENAVSEKYRSGSNPWFAHIQAAKRHTEDAAAIRALAKGGI